MKTAWLILLFTLVFTPKTSFADPIVVRSGEHDSFTRIVMELPEGSTWKVETQPGRSVLNIGGFDGGFDLSAAFDVIPRTRLSALLARAATLELQLTCDCPVNAFLENNGFLVLDIKDGPPIETESVVIANSSALPATNFTYGELLWVDPEGSAPEIVAAEVIGTSLTAISQPSNPDPTPQAEAVLQTQERLLEAFSDAASRGLLSLTDTDTFDPPDRLEDEQQTEIFDSYSTETDAIIPRSSQIRVTSSKDIPAQNISDQFQLSGEQCPGEVITSVSTWGNGKTFNEQLRQSQNRLFDELGRLQKGALIQHIRLYIYFGFGAEAMRYLEMAPEIAASHPELVDIASILEYGYAKNPRVLHRYSGCASDVALWAILAAEDIPLEIEIHTEAALMALQSLPPSLRLFAGQALSDRLLRRGDIANAGIAMRSYQSLKGYDQKTPKLADAEASELRGNEVTANDLLNEIIAEDTPQAPKAIISLVDSHVKEDVAISADIALLAEAYAFEFRNTRQGAQLFRAHVLAAAKSAQYQKAFTALSESQIELRNEVATELTSFVFSEVSTRASDVFFLETYFEKYEQFEDGLSDRSKFEIAQRLLALGFVDHADQLNSMIPKSFETRERSILTAKIHLRQKRYSESLDEIMELEGEDVAEIRANAFERLGRNQAAAQIFGTSQRPERASTSLWLTEEWSQLIDETDPVFGTFSQLSREQTVDVSVDNQMLSNSQAAISSSAQARASIETALNALRISDE